jgi:LEA14-like dessication related protein
MRSLVLVIAVALACSGCMASSAKPDLSGAKAGDGHVKRTQFIEI